MSLVRAYKIPVEAYRGDSIESRHLVYAAACNVDAASEYECDGRRQPAVWMRSTAKPFQLLPLLLQPAGRDFLQDPRDIAISAASHDGTEAHAARVRAMLERGGLDTELLRCGVHRPYFLEQLRHDAVEHGQQFSELHNNCSGHHAAMLYWARLQGVALQSYLDPRTSAQQIIHQIIEAMSGAQPSIAIDNCGSPCYQLPLANVAISYLALADAADLQLVVDASTEQSYAAMLRERLAPLGSFSLVQTQLDTISTAMASHPEWVSGENTPATVLAQQFSNTLVVKHGAEGVLCVAHRKQRASIALKAMDGNGRAVFPALLRLMQEFGWIDSSAARWVEPLAQPTIIGPPGHLVGGLRVAKGKNAFSK